MQKITILGLAVAISMMSCIVSVAEAEPILSPYQQARDGTPVGEVVCAGDRMLMLSPSGMPACVFAESVEVLERRGFVLLSEMPRDDLSAKQPGSIGKSRRNRQSGRAQNGRQAVRHHLADRLAERVDNHPGGEHHWSIHCRLGRWNRNKRHRGRIALLTLVPESTKSSYPATLQESISAAAPMRKSCNL